MTKEERREYYLQWYAKTKADPDIYKRFLARHRDYERAKRSRRQKE